jgi:RNA polymerase sigma-70 factor (ECF subfamily)
MMNWPEIEGQENQRKEKSVHNFGIVTNNELAAIEGKHEQLVENLQEKYGMFPKGKPFDEFFEAKIARSIESLPGNLRSVVLLSDVEELRYTEIAKTLSCPIGTVCSRLHRGRKKVRQSLLNFSAENGGGKFEDSENLQKESFK